MVNNILLQCVWGQRENWRRFMEGAIAGVELGRMSRDWLKTEKWVGPKGN